MERPGPLVASSAETIEVVPYYPSQLDAVYRGEIRFHPLPSNITEPIAPGHTQEVNQCAGIVKTIHILNISGYLKSDVASFRS